MLIGAALLLVAVSAMHSGLGGWRLIAPLCRLPDLPIILGSRRNTVLTLTLGWHLLSVFWLYLAAMLICLHTDVPAFSGLFVSSFAFLSITCGLGALLLSRGRHLSWALFLPLGLILMVAPVPG